MMVSSPVSFADVKMSPSAVAAQEQEEDNLTSQEAAKVEASANESWKSSANRNLWLDTLDDECLSSDEEQNDIVS
jgi:hypothetical protein